PLQTGIRANDAVYLLQLNDNRARIEVLHNQPNLIVPVAGASIGQLDAVLVTGVGRQSEVERATDRERHPALEALRRNVGGIGVEDGNLTISAVAGVENSGIAAAENVLMAVIGERAARYAVARRA